MLPIRLLSSCLVLPHNQPATAPQQPTGGALLSLPATGTEVGGSARWPGRSI